jgi:hypothetical protein
MIHDVNLQSIGIIVMNTEHIGRVKVQHSHSSLSLCFCTRSRTFFRTIFEGFGVDLEHIN